MEKFWLVGADYRDGETKLGADFFKSGAKYRLIIAEGNNVWPVAPENLPTAGHRITDHHLIGEALKTNCGGARQGFVPRRAALELRDRLVMRHGDYQIVAQLPCLPQKMPVTVMKPIKYAKN